MIDITPIGRMRLVKVGEVDALLPAKPGPEWARFAKKAEISNAQLVEAMTAPAKEDKGKFRILIRPTMAPASKGTELEFDDPLVAWQESLKHYADTYSVIQWSGRDRIALLDVDFHLHEPPPPSRVEAVMRRIRPAPHFFWRSHGGGMHLLYFEHEGFRADELASAAALAALDFCPTATVEVLSITTHPHCQRVKNKVPQRCGDLTRGAATVKGSLASWIGSTYTEVDEAEIEAWLDRNGLEMGERAEHNRCPFDTTRSDGNPCVEVKEDGILCHRCKNTGHISKGYSSWDKLIGHQRQNRIVECAELLVPWDHAGVIVENDFGHRAAPGLALNAYVALCKILHAPDDPRIPRVRTPFLAIRGSGDVWLDPVKLTPITGGLHASRFVENPYCMWASKDGGMWETGPVMLKVDQCQSNNRLPGYLPVLPVHGGRLWGRFLPYPNEDLVHAIRVDPEVGSPKYLAAKDRDPDAWAYLEKCFPGVNMGYLKLLMVARGHAESGAGLVPMIIATGVSGSGKTGTAEIASAILGDRADSVDSTGEKFVENFGTAAMGAAGIILLDEFAKDLHGQALRHRFNFLLSVTRAYRHRVLYAGWTTVPMRSAILVANNFYTAPVMENKQIGRRCVYVHLPREVPQWDMTCGSSSISRWRLDNPVVCDSIYSEIVDEFFTSVQGAAEGKLSFRQAAERCGFKLLQDSEGATEDEGVKTHHLVQELFDLVCELPAAPARWRGRGWKVFEVDDNSDIGKVWRELRDNGEGAGAGSSMIISERDITSILGTKHIGTLPVVLKTSLHGRKLGIKFQAGRGSGAFINEEIRDGKPLEPMQAEIGA